MSYYQTPLPSPGTPLPTLSGSSISAPSVHLEQVPEEKTLPAVMNDVQEPETSSSEIRTQNTFPGSVDKMLYMVEFKAARSDLFYAPRAIRLNLNDLVIVEADRGEDLGKIVMTDITSEQVTLLQQQQQQQQVRQGRQDQREQQLNKVVSSTTDPTPSTTSPSPSATTAPVESSLAEVPSSSLPSSSLPVPFAAGELQQQLKRIIRLATPEEISQISEKAQDERKALQVCQQKIKQRKLRMDVVDAEYQWYLFSITILPQNHA